MAHAVQVRAISNDEGNRLLRIVRRGTGSVVTWRRGQMVLLSAQHMPVAKIAGSVDHGCITVRQRPARERIPRPRRRPDRSIHQSAEQVAGTTLGPPTARRPDRSGDDEGLCSSPRACRAHGCGR